MPVPNQALPGGYQLLNYRIDRQISRGGFSIVYRAFDETGAPVAIKEYLPSSLVLRTEGDIKPANIYLRTDGSPVLLDFGAARQTLTSNRPKLAPMYTPGFAAPEQYRDPDRLGPWTDVYGTGASMFACLAAFAPQAADARIQEDHLVPAKRIWSGQYSDNLLEVIDWCLRLDPLERPQSVFALQRAIRDIPPRKRKLTLL